MTAQPSDVFELLRKIRYDLTAAQAKVTDALNTLAALNLKDTPHAVCPTCGVHTRGPRSLAEHVYTSHAGPVPDHYLAAEALAGLEPIESEQAKAEAA